MQLFIHSERVHCKARSQHIYTQRQADIQTQQMKMPTKNTSFRPHCRSLLYLGRPSPASPLARLCPFIRPLRQLVYRIHPLLGCSGELEGATVHCLVMFLFRLLPMDLGWGTGKWESCSVASSSRRLLCLAEVAVISRYSDICHEYCMALLWLCLRALATTQVEKQSMPWIEANLDLWGIPEHVFCIFHVGRLTIYLCMSPIQ